VIVSLKNLGDLYYYVISSMPEALRCYRRAAELLDLQVKADPGNVAWRANLSEILTTLPASWWRRIMWRKPNLTTCAAWRWPRKWRTCRVHRRTDVQLRMAGGDGGPGGSAESFRGPALRHQSSGIEQEPGSADPACAFPGLFGVGRYQRAIDIEEKALALFPPVETGKPVPRNRGVVSGSLDEYRKKLAKAAK